MIERKIVAEKVREFMIQEYIRKSLRNIGIASVKMQPTPLGDKIILEALRPGAVVGRSGQNIKKLTEDLKKEFNLDNPQIEINEIIQPNLDAQIVAESIASALERFGSQRFKGIGHKVMSDVMSAGALGVEVLISGKIPSARARSWRFYQGYLKKCGDTALTGVRKAYTTAELKTGTVGIQVRIMPSNIILPDHVEVLTEAVEVVEEVKPKKAPKKKATKKKNEKEGS